MADCKIGFGFDIHRLQEGRKLFLGGIEIPFIKGLLGYSDADALLHAICDAILGALGLGDIGEHFPDSDPAYKDIASSQLLIKVYQLMKQQKFVIGNLDTMILAEQPKIAPFKEKMKNKIANLLGTQPEKINIKAGTAEGLGLVGEGQAIAAYAVVTLIRG